MSVKKLGYAILLYYCLPFKNPANKNLLTVSFQGFNRYQGNSHVIFAYVSSGFMF
jgi:hypothetical protein